MDYSTNQEDFWAGNFGNNYIHRNNNKNLLASNLNFFSKALNKTHDINNCIEFGANIGMNLRALKSLFPNIELSAVEINEKACLELDNLIGSENTFNTSIFDFDIKKKFKLCLISGVLIHIDPKKLPIVYEKLFDSSEKYILIAEYYNPTPVKLDYRGHSDKLYKRDFAGEFMNLYKDTFLLDYGFIYHRDNNFPKDDINWFLIEKR